MHPSQVYVRLLDAGRQTYDLCTYCAYSMTVNSSNLSGQQLEIMGKFEKLRLIHFL